MNFLEELVAEWYEHQGYFLRRNVKVAPRRKGGYDGELDVVAFRPETSHLVHVEASMDADSWAERDRRFAKKFQLGREHIPAMFPGLDLPHQIEQVAVLGLVGRTHRSTVGNGRVVSVQTLLRRILSYLRTTSWESSAVPEHLPILRTLQLVSHYSKDLEDILSHKSST